MYTVVVDTTNPQHTMQNAVLNRLGFVKEKQQEQWPTIRVWGKRNDVVNFLTNELGDAESGGEYFADHAYEATDTAVLGRVANVIREAENLVPTVIFQDDGIMGPRLSIVGGTGDAISEPRWIHRDDPVLSTDVEAYGKVKAILPDRFSVEWGAGAISAGDTVWYTPDALEIGQPYEYVYVDVNKMAADQF